MNEQEFQAGVLKAIVGEYQEIIIDILDRVHSFPPSAPIATVFSKTSYLPQMQQKVNDVDELLRKIK